MILPRSTSSAPQDPLFARPATRGARGRWGSSEKVFLRTGLSWAKMDVGLAIVSFLDPDSPWGGSRSPRGGGGRGSAEKAKEGRFPGWSSNHQEKWRSGSEKGGGIRNSKNTESRVQPPKVCLVSKGVGCGWAGPAVRRKHRRNNIMAEVSIYSVYL